MAARKDRSGDRAVWRSGARQVHRRAGKAALLLGTFLHELGHHVDRITSRNQLHIGNGEPFAERFNRDMAEKIWQAYTRTFNL